MIDGELDKEALELLRAFMTIKDSEARSVIIALVEAAARGASISLKTTSVAKLRPEQTITN